MNNLPKIYLARHGETAWSITGQHTGLSDIPLTNQGEMEARALGQRLNSRPVTHVFTSPLQRAKRTGELAGFGSAAVDPDLSEWNYGDYDGLRSLEIHQKRPDWQLFRDGCPNGETVAEIGSRADRVVNRIRSLNSDVLLFSHGHFLRVLAARWLGLAPSESRLFRLDTASLSILGFEHNQSEPVLHLWNEDCTFDSKHK